MAIDNPPAYLQAGSYSASRDRLHLISVRYYPTTLNTTDAACRSGILGGQSGRQANYSMTNWDLSVGRLVAAIENTFAIQGGDYQVLNPATQILSITPSSTTTNRIDIVGIRIQDAFYSGANNQGDLVVVPGTPTAGTPADPTLPTSFIPIVRVTVNANTSTGILTDLRKRTGTMGSVYSPYTGQLTDSGTMVGETQIMPAAGVYISRLRTWDGTVWRGVTSHQFDSPTQTGSGTLPVGGTGVTIMTVPVADPGYAYKLNVSGSLAWAVVAATTPGYLLQGSVTLDNTAYNAGMVTTGESVSHSIGAGFNQSSLSIMPDTTAALTGAHTIRLIARNSGAGNMLLPVSASTNLNVTLIPA